MWKQFADDISGIKFYEFALGSAPESVDVVDWTIIEQDTLTSVDTLELVDAQIYYGLVRATDRAGNVSTVSVSNGITLITMIWH